MSAASLNALTFALFLLTGIATAGGARAHCDGLDGPVVAAARVALDSGDVNRLLIWMPEGDAVVLRAVFDRAVAVRKLGAEARALADMSVFESAVRLHRAAEGAPYTGLKPAGRDLGPAIPAADAALETGNDAALIHLLSSRLEQRLHERFVETRGKRGFAADDVAAGRVYVNAYVTFLNFVERVHESIEQEPGHHFPED